MDDYEDVVGDKQWAKKYLLDPLHGPEPSQECGPGSSFRNLTGPQRSRSVQSKPAKTKPLPNRNKPLPSPPTSSPPRSRQRPKPSTSHSSGPAALDKSKYRNLPDEDTEEDVKLLHKFLVRSQSVTEARTTSTSRSRRNYPPSASLNRSKTVHATLPRETSWNQGTILNRKNSVAASTKSRPATPNSRKDHRSTGSIVASPVASPLALPVAYPMASPVARNTDSDKGKGLRRSGSLTARYPGDMSHRPLDIIKQEHRQAMRAPYLHNPRHRQPADTIDTLDQSGVVDVPYHHDGPYDATMASRNRQKLYSPVDAVKESNAEAIKATPREYIQDSLVKHVPLQGTAVIPPGMPDMSGRTMEYEEGADLMREGDAPGGAYKRYEGIRYLDDDLKGKGEPSFTIERDRKEQKARLRKHSGSRNSESGSQVYEMQPQAHGSSSRKDHGAQVRQRSISNADARRDPGPASPLVRRNSRNETYATDSDLRRRNTTGNKFAEGLKRRFGSLRRKKNSDDDDDYY